MAVTAPQEPEIPAIGEEEAARASVYGLLGALLAGPPSAELLTHLGQLDAAEAEGADLAEAWRELGEAARAARAVAPDDLASEYHTLFIGLGRGELVPYGSWYLSGFLMEAPLAKLRDDLAALGFERRDDVSEPEDHAAAICEIMSMLIAGDDPQPFDTQQTFFQDHADPWLGRFFADLRSAEAASFYRAVGRLGEEFAAVERTYFSMMV